MAIGYGILVTVCAGICTAEFQAACAQFGQMLAETGPAWQAIFGWPAWCAGGAAMWSDSETISGVWYWIVMFGTWGMVGFGLLTGAVAMTAFLSYCRDNLADIRSLTVILVTAAIGVFFAGPLRSAGINAVLLILLVLVGYFAVRGVRIYRDSR